MKSLDSATNKSEHGSVVLIGMPGAGKSTIGVLLARELALDFVDTDLSIQVHCGATLQQVLNDRGYLGLREIEEEVLLLTDVEGRVIATGGSAVYSDKAMQHLKALATTIYLRVDLSTLSQRIDNFNSRGIARQPGQSLDSLYEERGRLYTQYADLIVDATGSPASVVNQILTALQANPKPAK